jgi:suppressor for copper-sensitivity B
MSIGRACLVIASFAVAGPASAASSAWFETDHGGVRLIAASDAVGDAERVSAGLHFRMKKGWKIYWRSPGDAGFPPQPDWAGSENLAEAALAWPAPERFAVLGLQTLGYKDEVVLPVALEPFEAGKPMRLKARVAYLTCDDICVPYDAVLALDLPAGPETATREAALIERFAARVPSATGGGLSLDAAEVAEDASRGELRLRIAAQTPLQRPDAFVEGSRSLSFGEPRVEFADEGRSALMRIAVAAPPGKPVGLADQALTVTVVDGPRAIERSVTVARSAVPLAVARAPTGAQAAPAAESLSWLAVLGLALLGGLILNVMPCVLPVLSIKLLSVLGHGGAAPREVRRGFLASAAGILASFLVLGSVAVGLKAAGHAVGWGIQFQQPAFLAAMAFVLVLFAANLWERFEVALPASVAGAADAAGRREGLAGHFLTGALATLLATPCSAPFLGTAVGFALAHGPVEIYAVFAALGLGLALPYLVVAAAPRLATRLPRPGGWMVAVRRVLGLALAATAVWLLFVLGAQSGPVVAGLVATLLVATGVALWPLPEASARGRLASWLTVGALGLLAVGGVLALPGERGASAGSVAAEGPWRPFDRAAIAREVAAGRVVFVDVTADWCLTCRVNKELVLDRGDVRALLAAPDVVAMRADWTKPDPAIADYLKSFGRFGIPFNVVYGPGRPGGEPLPELLTERAVVAAFEAAGGTARVSRR